MTPEDFDKMIDDFGRQCGRLGQMDPAVCYDPMRPYQAKAVNDLRALIKQVYRDACRR